MAMYGQTRDRVHSGLARCARVRNSTGSLRGEPGEHFGGLGWLAGRLSAQESRRLLGMLAEATYVVYSYDTPIGFVYDGEQYVIEETHSQTTSNHVGALKYAWHGDYEDPIPTYVRRKAEQVREERNRRARERRAAARQPRATEGELRAEWMQATGQQQDVGRTAPPGPPVRVFFEDEPVLPSPATEHASQDVLEYVGMAPSRRNEDDGELTNLAVLLDPRYANPDWVPGRDSTTQAQDYIRENADAERVARESPWWENRAHP